MSDLDELMDCEREELLLQWRMVFASSPPKHTSTLFLQKVLAHDHQCKAEGDVSTRTRRVLKHALKVAHRSSISSEAASSKWAQRETGRLQSQLPASVHALSAGVQLVREWNGRTWQVEVLEDGFICGGKTYRSLSAIARMITGTRWSGPRFFGLTP